MKTIGQVVNRVKNRLAFTPSYTWVCPDTDIGVEFEFERVGRLPPGTAALLYWDIKDDHSLHDAGKEFTFKVPMFGVDAERAIEELVATAIAHNWACSSRCGLHVHLDVRDLSPEQLTGLIGYYCLFEPAIYNWVGDSREFNNFCLPYYRATESLAQAAEILKVCLRSERHNDPDAVNAITEYHRYSGLNLKSLAEFGSIEFRHLRTTTDIARIKQWINIIFSLKMAARTVAASHRYSVLGDVWTRPPQDIIQAAMPHCAKELSNYPEFAEDLRFVGFPSAYDFLNRVDEVQLKDRPAKVYDTWEDTPPKDSASHKGFRAWIGNNFPKGQELTVEKPPPLNVEPAPQVFTMD